MPISQLGAINTAALVVPDLYLQIVPPQNLVLNGVPTNRVGVVGTAIWGPVNQPVIVGDFPSYVRNFGLLQARKFDMGTHVAILVQQGAQDMRCVRVTDGTDTAASASLVTSCLTLTAYYSGTYGNGISVSLQAGSKANSWAVVVSAPGQQPERFDNITGTGNAFWLAAAAAINAGSSTLRGRSNFVVATPGGGTTAPSATTVALSGGTDGTGTITSAVLIGLDNIPRTGMYALRGQGSAVLDLCDADDSTQWTVADGLSLSEGFYNIAVMPSGTTIANAVTAKATAGLDSPWTKLMHGDWIYWNDPVNQIIRLVSPQAFVAGRLANLSPQNSTLNKPLYGVVGSQKSGGPLAAMATSYSTAELSTLFSAGIDVISNPQPGGSYWGVRAGHNSSSDPSRNGDNYTRMTNFIAATVNSGMGIYVGQVINARLFQRIKSTLVSFLNNLLGQGILGTLDGSLPFGVVCDLTNNPQSRTGIGYVQADCQVQYQGINEKFIVNLEGGTTVTVTRQTLPSGQIAA